jgi:hypothetical protein
MLIKRMMEHTRPPRVAKNDGHRGKYNFHDNDRNDRNVRIDRDDRNDRNRLQEP